MLAPLDFIARQVALIPPPHFNMVRYHGVLAARAHVRSEVVPGPSAVEIADSRDDVARVLATIGLGPRPPPRPRPALPGQLEFNLAV